MLCQGPERRYILDPDRWIVKGDEEMRALAAEPDAVPRKPYWDPTLRDDPRQMLRALDEAGLLPWRRRRRAEAGCFFVKKKDGTLRLVIDARIAKACHRRRPHSDMAVPGAIARVVLSDSGLEIASGGPVAADAVGLRGSAVDFTDGFYQFRCK